MNSPCSNEEPSARQKIIQAASALFAAKGLDGVSTREIAKAADLNISLISYYFGGKEGLYRAVIEDFAKGSEAALDEIMKGFSPDHLTKKSYQEFMKAVIDGLLQMKLCNPHIDYIMLREALSGLQFSRDVHDQTFSKLGLILAGLLEKAQTLKIVRPDINPHVVFISMVNAVELFFVINKFQTTFLKKCPRLPDEVKDYGDNLYKIFVEGVML